ncbi:MAG: hypothetical protein EB127_00325 [Alphaproteobacteria bacterium]|nr:hypothetical protein [Alphaproteobacteria bacterium]
MIEHINQAANSPFIIGIMMLLLNIGSRFIVHEFSVDDKEYSQNIFLRRLTVFAVCFVGTRDIVVSTILTAAFVILASGIFRGKGPFSREGMENPDIALRAAAGLSGKIDSPGYSMEEKPLFK